MGRIMRKPETELLRIVKVANRPKDRTAHKWQAAHDAKCCIACEQPFKHGDIVINDCALTVHYTRECVNKYNADSKELGLC